MRWEREIVHALSKECVKVVHTNHRVLSNQIKFQHKMDTGSDAEGSRGSQNSLPEKKGSDRMCDTPTTPYYDIVPRQGTPVYIRSDRDGVWRRLPDSGWKMRIALLRSAVITIIESLALWLVKNMWFVFSAQFYSLRNSTLLSFCFQALTDTNRTKVLALQLCYTQQ